MTKTKGREKDPKKLIQQKSIKQKLEKGARIARKQKLRWQGKLYWQQYLMAHHAGQCMMRRPRVRKTEP